MSLRFGLVEGATSSTAIPSANQRSLTVGNGGTIEMTSVYVSEEALGLEIVSVLLKAPACDRVHYPGPVSPLPFQ